MQRHQICIYASIAIDAHCTDPQLTRTDSPSAITKEANLGQDSSIWIEFGISLQVSGAGAGSKGQMWTTVC